MRATLRLSSPAPLASPKHDVVDPRRVEVGRARRAARARRARRGRPGARRPARRRSGRTACARRRGRSASLMRAPPIARARAAPSSSCVGRLGRVCRSSATCSSQPVAARAWSTVDARVHVRSASARSVSGSGSSTPRSVITRDGPAAAQAEPLAVARAVAVADRGDEVDLLDERARASGARSRSTSPHEAAISGAPPAPGSRTFGCVVVVADHGRVDVARSGRSAPRRGSRRRSGPAAASS